MRPAHWRRPGTSCRIGNSTRCAKCAGRAVAPDRNCFTFSIPAPVDALTNATGQLSWLANMATSNSPPRRSKSSAIFRTTSVGKPRLRMGEPSTRCRFRLVESRISRTASGLPTSAFSPCRMSWVTSSSSERGARLYTPGRSTIRTSFSVSKIARPMWCSTVTPGKLATFWRNPVRRLKRVVFPEFGGPTSATV